MALISFDDYSSGKKPLTEKKKLKRSEKRKGKKVQERIETSTPNFKKLTNKIGKKTLKKVNENSFQVGDDYKVKIVIDVPVSLVKEYSEKVQQETGKDALENFSESELAEQMIDYIVKQNLNIDNIPTSLAVGEDVIEQGETQPEEVVEADADQVEEETSTESDITEESEGDDDGLLGMSDDDITFEDDTESEGEESEGGELEFEAEEKDLDEDIVVEEESDEEEEFETDKSKTEKPSEEEESLDDMFQQILKK